MPFVYEYPRPAVCVDCVIFGWERPTRGRLTKVDVLLIRRGRPPFEGTWALPGGFVEIEEPLLDAAFRELYEETAIRPKSLELVGVYGAPGRDPRGRTISIVYRGLIWKDEHTVLNGDDASQAGWFSLGELPPLAFDHDQIIADVWQGLQHCASTQPFGREILPPVFSWHELRSLYEAILGASFSPRRLKSFLVKVGLLKPAESAALQEKPAGKQAKGGLFQFDEAIYQELTKTGFSPFLCGKRCD